MRTLYKIGKFKMYMYNYLGCLTVMYNANVIGLIQIPNLEKRNDCAMWLRIVKKTLCHLIPEELSRYRVRKSGSITNIKVGKIRLIKHHYVLFRESENMSVVLSVVLSFIKHSENIYFGIKK